jgi:hypothetical protein
LVIWTDLVFCGFDTDTCILKSVADAFEREHIPWLVRDACASHGSRGQHRTTVTMAGRFIGERQLITRHHVATALATSIPQNRKEIHVSTDAIVMLKEDHSRIKRLFRDFELATMTPDDERFDAKTTVLIESVRHHIDEEEQDWFPKVREGLGRKALQDIGAEMAELRKKPPAAPPSQAR